MARRGDRSAPKLTARDRYLQKVQNNRIKSQLEQLYAVGNTAEDIRNAGNDAWYELGGPDIIKDQLTGQFSYGEGGPTDYTVRDGDTPASIAAANGTTVPDLLNTNPDVNKLQTGMVVKLPTAYQQSERSYVQNLSAYQNSERGGNKPLGQTFQGSLGLPSTAALGQLSGNISGMAAGNRPATSGQQWNNMNYYTGGSRPPTPRPGPVTVNTPGQQISYQSTVEGGGYRTNYMNTLGTSQTTQPWNNMNYYTSGIGGQPSPTLGSIASQMQGTIAAQGAPGTTTSPTTPPRSQSPSQGLPANYPGGFRRWATERLAQISDPDSSNMPHPAVVDYLTKIGLLVPAGNTPPRGGGGGGGYGSGGGPQRGGGGGGGRGRGSGGGGMPRLNSGGRPQQPERLPAFSSNAGLRGLVSWRL